MMDQSKQQTEETDGGLVATWSGPVPGVDIPISVLCEWDCYGDKGQLLSDHKAFILTNDGEWWVHDSCVQIVIDALDAKGLINWPQNEADTKDE